MPAIALEHTASMAHLDDWETTYNTLFHMLEKVPQVASGAVTFEQAKSWLQAAAKVLPENSVYKQLLEKTGFNQQESRALWAHENGEYYPSLSALEVYSSKSFRSIHINNDDEKKIVFARSLANKIAHAKLPIHQDPILKTKLHTAQQPYNWLRTESNLVATLDGAHSSFQFKTNYHTNVTTSDSFRLHQDGLVAVTHGVEIKNLYQCNLLIPQTLLDSLYTISKLGKSHYINAISSAIALEKNGEINLIVEKVPFSESIAAQCINTTQKHWLNIQQGLEPQFTKDTKIELTQAQQQSLKTLSKNILAAGKIQQAAKDLEDRSKANLSLWAQNVGIESNHDLPYKAVLLRKRDELDLLSLGQFLQNHHSLPDQSLKKRVVDYVSLEREVSALGINIDDFSHFEGFDKDKCLTAAKQFDVDVKAFQKRTFDVYQNGQSRGPIHEAKLEAEQVAAELTTQIMRQVASSPKLDHQAFSGIDTRIKSKSSSQELEQ